MDQLGLHLDGERAPSAPTVSRPTLLDAAKAWLAERFEGGAHCPCCGLFVKLYRRKLNSGMAAGLCRMYAWHRDHGWSKAFDSHDLIHDGRRLDADFAKLRFWGLIERLGEGEQAPRRTSHYRITDAGRRFVEGQIEVKRYVFLFNDEAVTRDVEEMISMRQALADRFSYAELMGARP